VKNAVKFKEFHQNLKSFFCGGWWESIISYNDRLLKLMRITSGREVFRTLIWYVLKGICDTVYTGCIKILMMMVSAIESSKQCYRLLSYIFIYLVLIT
jgi:uncharacterized membrane protein